MPLPLWVARFNKRFTNRFIEPVARRSTGFAVVHHRGRRSGTAYTTPVNLFAAGDTMLVVLTYGPSADWVCNVLAGPARLEVGSVIHPIVDAVVVERSDAVSAMPAVVRVATRILGVRDFLRLTIDSGA